MNTYKALKERAQQLTVHALRDEELVALVTGASPDSIREQMANYTTNLNTLLTDPPNTLTPTQKLRLQSALELVRRANQQLYYERPQIRAPEDAYQLVAPMFVADPRERFLAIALDLKHRVNGILTIAVGTLESAPVDPRSVFSLLLRYSTPIWIAMHNHPSGDPNPSDADIAITKRLVQAGQILNIELLDHIIVGQGEYRSLRELGHL